MSINVMAIALFWPVDVREANFMVFMQLAVNMCPTT